MLKVAINTFFQRESIVSIPYALFVVSVRVDSLMMCVVVIGQSVTVKQTIYSGSTPGGNQRVFGTVHTLDYVISAMLRS